MRLGVGLACVALAAAACVAVATEPNFPLDDDPTKPIDESKLPLVFQTPKYQAKLEGLEGPERWKEIRRIMKKRREKGMLDEVPYVRLKDSEVRTLGGCQFKGCPADHPYVYYLTSHRNRAASYNRMLRTLAADLASDVNSHPPACVCAAAADYNDVVVGPTVWQALEDWPYDKAVIELKGPFSRAGGFQRCMDHLVTTPRDESIVFLLDADLLAYSGLLNRIMTYTKLDKWAFAPALWSTTNNATDTYDGYWRSGGTGMISFFVSELDKFGGTLPKVSKISWGGEDHYLTKYLQKKAMLKIKRTCTPELWHLYHAKATWSGAADGRHHPRGSEVSPEREVLTDWKLPITHRDGVSKLEDRRAMDQYRCRMLAAGTLYPREVAPGEHLTRKRGPI